MNRQLTELNKFKSPL